MRKVRERKFKECYDKYRSKLAKEKVMVAQTHGNNSPFAEATKKHMALHTFAPDLVKWTRKDIAKLLQGNKKVE